MTGMMPYYVSRAVLALVFGALFVFTGSPWWTGLLIGVGTLAFFLWAPHSGRYAVHPEFGVTALRRDERTEGVNDKAARNAFVTTMLVLGFLIVSYGAASLPGVPLVTLKGLLVLGAVVYFLSDFWLRRTR